MNERLEYLKKQWAKLMERIKHRDHETDMWKDYADRLKSDIEEIERADTEKPPY